MRVAAALRIILFYMAWAIITLPATAGSTQYSYDALGRLVGVFTADEAKTAYAFDAAGNRTQVQTVTEVSTPSTSLTASPSNVTVGTPITLTWLNNGAKSAAIDHGIGNVSPVSGGSVTVTPTETTTYTITAQNAIGGVVSKSVTVNVYAAPSGAISVSSGAITAGSPITLNWSGSNAASASIDQGIGSVNPAGGSVTISPTSTTTYTLTLSNPAGMTVTKSVVVNVYAAPTGYLSVNKNAITSGNAVTLSWAGSNAASASIDQGIGSVNPAGGSVTVSPSSTTTYTLTLANAVGATVTKSVTVNVYAAPAGTLSANATSIAKGAPVTLSWTSSNATSAYIDHIGSVTPVTGGAVTVTPTETTTYTLSLPNAAGTTFTTSVTVTVFGPPSVTIETSNTQIGAGQTATLTWFSSGATSATLNGSSVALSGSRVVAPNKLTTYTIVVKNDVGQTATAFVSVGVTKSGGGTNPNN